MERIKLYVNRSLGTAKLAVHRYSLIGRCTWALKFALIACLPGAFLQVDESTSTILTPPFILMSFIVVTTAGTFGRGFSNFLVALKIVFTAYPLTTVCVAADLATHWLLWGSVFFLGVFVIALLTDFVVTINSELLFIIAMVHVKQNDFGGRSKEMYTTYQLRDVLIGVGLGLVSSIFPFLPDEFRECKRVDEKANALCCELLQTVVDAVAAQSSAHRMSLLIRIGRLTEDARCSVALLKDHTQFSWYELVNSLRIAELESKIVLYENLLNHALSMTAVARTWNHDINSEVDPQLMGLVCTITAVAKRCSLTIRELARRRKEIDDNVEIDQCIEQLREAWWVMKNNARPAAAGPEWEEHVAEPLDPTDGVEVSPSAPLIELADCRASSSSSRIDSNIALHGLGYITFELDSVLSALRCYESPLLWSRPRKLAEVLTWPLRECRSSLDMLRQVWMWTPSGRQRFVFALKLSVTLTSFVAYLLNKEVGDLYFGPAQMAFAAGLDSSKAVAIFGSQLIGSVLGTVVGYMLSTTCHTTTDFVVAATCGALITGFFRSSSAFALAAIYVQFSFFGSLRNWPGEGAALTSILTNTAAMGLYTAVQVLIFPANPWEDLRTEMKRVLSEVQSTLEATHDMLLNNSFPHSNAPLAEPRPKLREAFASVQQQLSLVDGAAAQPRFSQRPFPTHEVLQVIKFEMDVIGLLAPLSASWRQVEELQFETETSSACAVAVRRVSVKASSFMGHVKSLMDHASRSDEVLDVTSATLAYAELDAARSVLLEALIDAFRGSIRGNVSVVEARGATPCLMETVTFCCSVLPSSILRLFNALVDLLDASRLL